MSQESKNLRIEERKNRKHINRGTQESKISERCAQCTLVLLDVSRIEERKIRRTQEPMSSGLCAHAPHAHYHHWASQESTNSGILERKIRRMQEYKNGRMHELKIYAHCAPCISSCWPLVQMLAYLRAS